MRAVRNHFLILLLPAIVAVGVSFTATKAQRRAATAHRAVGYVETGRGQLARVAAHLRDLRVCEQTVRRLERRKKDHPYRGFLATPSIRNENRAREMLYRAQPEKELRLEETDVLTRARAMDLSERLAVSPLPDDVLQVELVMADAPAYYPGSVLRLHLDTARLDQVLESERISTPEQVRARERLAALTKTLHEARQALDASDARYPEGDPAPRAAALRDRRARILAELGRIDAALQGERARAETLEKQKAALTPYVRVFAGTADGVAIPPKALDRMRRQKGNLEASLSRMLLNVTDIHPGAKRLRRDITYLASRIAELEAQREARETQTRRSEQYEANQKSLAESQALIARHEAEGRRLGEQLTGIDAQLQTLEPRARDFAAERDALLSRRRQAEARLRDARRGEAAVEQELRLAQVRDGLDRRRTLSMQSLGSPSITPLVSTAAGVPPALILCAAGLLGLLVGALWVWSIERSRTVIRSAGELQQAMGVPVLGVVPQASIDAHWQELPEGDTPRDPPFDSAGSTALALAGLVLFGVLIHLMASAASGPGPTADVGRWDLTVPYEGGDRAKPAVAPETNGESPAAPVLPDKTGGAAQKAPADKTKKMPADDTEKTAPVVQERPGVPATGTQPAPPAVKDKPSDTESKTPADDTEKMVPATKDKPAVDPSDPDDGQLFQLDDWDDGDAAAPDADGSAAPSDAADDKKP